MHADRQRSLRDWIALAFSTLGADTSWTVDIPAGALVAGVEHRIKVDGYTVAYTVKAGDTVADVSAGLTVAASPLSTAINPVSTTDLGGSVVFVAASPFVVIPEPPLRPLIVGTERVPVVWSNEAAPQPSVDFISINPGQDRPEGREEVDGNVDAMMSTTVVRSMRVQTIDVLLVGSWSGVCADDVRRALESPASVIALDPYVIRNVAVLLDATASSDTMWSARVALSVELGYADSRRIDGEPLEFIEATGTVGPQPVTITEP